MPKVAISIGDINGISLEIALKAHESIKKYANPIYVADKKLIKKGAKLLSLDIPKDFELCELGCDINIEPTQITKEAGAYSFASFLEAISMVEKKEVDFIVTLPISKEAWGKAGIEYKGHTDFFKHHYKKEAIMMLGCEHLQVALFTEHMALKDVFKTIDRVKICEFLQTLQKETKSKNIAVLGLNPHAGDGGVLGREDIEIEEAINMANKSLQEKIFYGPLVPDIAFIPKNRERFKLFVAMYHDQGLAPLKALHFEESINTTLNIPIKRFSPDHGCAYDIAYSGKPISLLSYINCFKLYYQNAL